MMMRHQIQTSQASWRVRSRQAGATLIELMVGVAIGLIVTLAIIGAVSTMNLQRRTTVSGNDAKENGQNAIAVIERVARLSGAGLFYNGQQICASLNAYRDGAVISNGGALAPVKIIDGGNTGSDKITFTYAEAPQGSSISHVVDNMPNSSSNFVVNNRGALAEGDLAIIGVPGSGRPCTLFQVTGFPPGGGNCNDITADCIKIQHNPGDSGPYNPPNPDHAFADSPRYGHETAGGVIGPAVVSRIGALHIDTFEVLCNSLVSSEAGKVASCTASPLGFTNAIPWVSNIVMLKAQYGITDSSDSDVVTSWVSATGPTWANPTPDVLPRIKAIRVAVVSRSPEPAATSVTSPCTNANGVANTGPCSFQDADSPVINLSNVPVPTGKTWRNYRYRVYHSVIPLRNVLWNY